MGWGCHPILLLPNAVKESIIARGVYLNDGTIIAAFGCAGIFMGDGSPWLVASNDLERYWKSFAIESLKVVREFRNLFFSLKNMVYVNNHMAIKWLKWCGFRLDGPVKWGPYEADFYELSIGPNTVINRGEE